ncbi:PH domain-containing protein [bacterium]|nr:MAG: PH domain-containing protein [bacterium]
MRTDLNLPAQFGAVKDDDEQLLWVGKPNFTVFMLTGVPFLIIGLLWGAFDFFFATKMFSGDSNAPLFFAVPFLLLHSAPCWLGIANMVRLFLVHGNTFYAVTTKRLMLRSGFWGTDFKTVDYDKIADMEVNVGPVENSLCVGTIRAFSGNTTSKGGRIYDSFIGIQQPYEVFKKIKGISVDVKTDWNYPNAIRPETNPGYGTKYEKKAE